MNVDSLFKTLGLLMSRVYFSFSFWKGEKRVPAEALWPGSWDTEGTKRKGRRIKMGRNRRWRVCCAAGTTPACDHEVRETLHTVTCVVV